jgi:Polyketide cyclase / dehydrase and lipid transport
MTGNVLFFESLGLCRDLPTGKHRSITGPVAVSILLTRLIKTSRARRTTITSTLCAKSIMSEYRLVTCWHIKAPLDAVFDALLDSLRWPEWWHGVESVTETAAGGASGIGSVRRYVWQGALPYRLSFDARARRIDAPRILEATVTGDLEGLGRWLFSHHGGITVVRHEWRVRTTRRWMNLMSPFARQLFLRNHAHLMQLGAEGLARRLGARLLRATHRALPRCEPPRGPALLRRPWFAAALAGIIGGIAATAAQVLLWYLAGFPLPGILWRDTRMAAAIVLGAGVLSSPGAMQWDVFCTATLLHFILSIAYGEACALLVTRLAMTAPAFAGALFGLLLFALNMFGFTLLYPWFEASRDWITAAAHAVFGIAAATTYFRLRDCGRMSGPA